MRNIIWFVVLCSALAACAEKQPVTEKVVVERERTMPPKREVVVERRTVPTLDGQLTEERVVQERVTPQREIRRTETTTTRE